MNPSYSSFPYLSSKALQIRHPLKLQPVGDLGRSQGLQLPGVTTHRPRGGGRGDQQIRSHRQRREIGGAAVRGAPADPHRVGGASGGGAGNEVVDGYSWWYKDPERVPRINRFMYESLLDLTSMT